MKKKKEKMDSTSAVGDSGALDKIKKRLLALEESITTEKEAEEKISVLLSTIREYLLSGLWREF